MELRVSKLREIIVGTIGQDLLNEGFTVNKPMTLIKKQVSKSNKIEIFIDCYNYAPSKLEFRLLLSFWIFEISQEMAKYYKHLGGEYNQKSETFILSEGEFNPELEGQEPKYRNAFTHIITDITDTDAAIAHCRSILHDEIIPKLKVFSVLKEFQNYILKTYKLPLKKRWIIEPAVISMKLLGMDELKAVVQQYWITANIEALPKDNFFRRFLENIVDYVEKNPN